MDLLSGKLQLSGKKCSTERKNDWETCLAFLGGLAAFQTALLYQGACPLEPAPLTLLNMHPVGHDTCTMVMLRWKSIPFSELNTQGARTVYFLRNSIAKDLDFGS